MKVYLAIGGYENSEDVTTAAIFTTAEAAYNYIKALSGTYPVARVVEFPVQTEFTFMVH
jgi:hypothetical protein